LLKIILNDHPIISRVVGIPLLVSEMEDSINWGLSRSGEFTMKSATWPAHGIQHSMDAPWPYLWIWKIDTLPKIQIFLWQICYQALPVRLLLHSRGIHIDPTCPLCCQTSKSLSHLFLSCPVTSKVWALAESHNWLPRGISLGNMPGIGHLSNRVHSLQPPQLKQRFSFIM